jgi:3',5'-cyclic AMP phosphodiesterase CpdA
LLIAHLSDLHFGRLTDDYVVDALVADVNSAQPDVVVISGDLTQRSRMREWAGARAFVNQLDRDPIVIPGNHDVYPWWFPVRRLIVPLRRYRQRFQFDLDTYVRQDNVVLVALNDAWGCTVKGGVFSPSQIARTARFMADNDDAEYRVLIVHHPVVKSVFTRRGDVALRSPALLEAASAAGVDIILDGHLHRTSIEALVIGGRSLVYCMAGTATSDRGRFEETGKNAYNLVRLDPSITAARRVYDAQSKLFGASGSVTFVRTDYGWERDAGSNSR